LLELLVGIGLLLLASLSKTDVLNIGQNAQDWLKDDGSTLVLIVGMIVLIVAMMDLVIRYGCFKGWGWVGTVGMVFAFISLVLSLFPAWSRGFTLSDTLSGLIGAIIPIIIILYLNTNKVRVWFGKSV
jgi:hypothetical protein